MDKKRFKDLFDEVLDLIRIRHCVNDEEISDAASVLEYTYSKEGQQEGSTREPLDYNNVASRCAYLHKYAPIHAVLIQDVLIYYHSRTNILRNLFLQRRKVNVCSLGGGPGVDVIGVLAFLAESFQIIHMDFSLDFSIIDCMEGWLSTFQTVLNVIAKGNYRSIRSFLGHGNHYFFLSDKLDDSGIRVKRTVNSADLLTMVKFVSAVNPSAVYMMIKKIFLWMKPGAIILFIDNAGGGFYNKVSRIATDCGMEAVFESELHRRYTYKALSQTRFGSFSLSSTAVISQIWKKPGQSTRSLSDSDHTNYQRPYQNQNANFASVASTSQYQQRDSLSLLNRYNNVNADVLQRPSVQFHDINWPMRQTERFVGSVVCFLNPTSYNEMMLNSGTNNRQVSMVRPAQRENPQRERASSNRLQTSDDTEKKDNGWCSIL